MSENKEVNEDVSKDTLGQEEIGRGSDSTSEASSSVHNVFDPLGLLTRSKYIAVAAADAAAECSLEKKRKPKHLEAESEVEEETRRKRLEANRKSAAESRKRKKILIEELQQTVKYLTEENDMLKRENAMLKMNQGKPSSQSIGIDNTKKNNIDSLGDVAVLSGSDQQQPYLPIPSFQGNFSYSLPNTDVTTQEILLQHQQQLLNNLNTTNPMAMSTDHYSSSNLLRNFQEQNQNIVFHPPQSIFDEMSEQDRDKKRRKGRHPTVL